MTIVGSAFQICTTPPGMKSSGANAATVVSTAKISGTLMRRVPRIAAMTPGVPFIRSRWMCSETTIASSTTMPMARTNENSETAWIARSNAIMTARAPMPETPRPTATQKASRSSRNSPRAINTNRSPRRPFLTRMAARSSKASDSSFQMVMPTPSGREGATFITFSPSALETSTKTAGRPWCRTIRSRSWNPSGVGHLPDLRPLGFARERLNTADRRLDVGQGHRLCPCPNAFPP